MFRRDIFAFNDLKQAELNEALAELLVKQPAVYFETIEKQALIFTPFGFNENVGTPLRDIDSAINLTMT